MYMLTPPAAVARCAVHRQDDRYTYRLVAHHACGHWHDEWYVWSTASYSMG